MKSIMHTIDVDEAVEAKAGVIIGVDIVAIIDKSTNLYYVYTKTGDYRWDLVMTTITLGNLMENEE